MMTASMVPSPGFIDLVSQELQQGRRNTPETLDDRLAEERPAAGPEVPRESSCNGTQQTLTETELQNMAFGLLDAPGAVPAHEPKAGATPQAEREGQVTKLEEALQSAAEAAFSFNLRGGVLGNEWMREKASNEQLAADYAQCKGYKAQRDFRAKWAENKWKHVLSRRTRAQSKSSSAAAVGKFRPIENWSKMRVAATLPRLASTTS